jgi:hypothetical protein
VLGASVVAAAVGVALQIPGPDRLTSDPVRYALALGLLSAAALLPNVPGPWIERITPLLLGGYLLQEPLYTQTLMRFERATDVHLSPVVLLAVAVPPTLWLVAVLRRTRLRAIL